MEMIRFTKKLKDQLYDLADENKCDRIAVLNPYTFEVIRVFDANNRFQKNWEKSTVEVSFDPEDKKYKWEHGEYKDPNRYKRESDCPPIKYHDGNFVSTVDQYGEEYVY